MPVCRGASTPHSLAELERERGVCSPALPTPPPHPAEAAAAARPKSAVRTSDRRGGGRCAGNTGPGTLRPPPLMSAHPPPFVLPAEKAPERARRVLFKAAPEDTGITAARGFGMTAPVSAAKICMSLTVQIAIPM